VPGELLGHRDVAPGGYEVGDEGPPEVVGAELLGARGPPQAPEDVVYGLVTYAPPLRPAVLEDRPEERPKLLAAVRDPALYGPASTAGRVDNPLVVAL
jgi:hypothetical protein